MNISHNSLTMVTVRGVGVALFVPVVYAALSKL